MYRIIYTQFILIHAYMGRERQRLNTYHPNENDHPRANYIFYCHLRPIVDVEKSTQVVFIVHTYNEIWTIRRVKTTNNLIKWKIEEGTFRLILICQFNR